MGYDDLPRRWQKTKGAVLVLVLAGLVWGGYRAYWTYQWAKAGLFRAHDAYGALAAPVTLPDNKILLVTVDGKQVAVPLVEILRAMASEHGQRSVSASQAAPRK